VSDQPDMATCFQAQRDDSMSAQGNALGNLAIVPSPPQLIFQFDTFSTGERARVRGRRDMENVDFENTSICTA